MTCTTCNAKSANRQCHDCIELERQLPRYLHTEAGRSFLAWNWRGYLDQHPPRLPRCSHGQGSKRPCKRVARWKMEDSDRVYCETHRPPYRNWRSTRVMCLITGIVLDAQILTAPKGGWPE